MKLAGLTWAPVFKLYAFGAFALGAALAAAPALAQNAPPNTPPPPSAGAIQSGAPVSGGPSQLDIYRDQIAQDAQEDTEKMNTLDQQALFIPAKSQFTEIPADQEVSEMGRGVNVLGYDDYWKTGSQAIYNDKTFKAIRDAGFKTVRINLQIIGGKHIDANANLDPMWLNRLDWVVGTAQKYKLHVILDEHDFNECSLAADACVTVLRAIWRQLGARYANEPNAVMFEMLNEPHGKITAKLWNLMIPRILEVIRKDNPERNVIVGPTTWNSMDDLQYLQLPGDDRHLIVTFHYYKPMTFTHQGASWVGPEIQAEHDVHFGSPEELKTINDDFDKVKAWSLDNDRPILLGEFGAYDKAPMDDRVTYTAAVARAAEAHGFAFAYWQFSSNFLLWDATTGTWVEPILHALAPDAKP